VRQAYATCFVDLLRHKVYDQPAPAPRPGSGGLARRPRSGGKYGAALSTARRPTSAGSRPGSASAAWMG
jgi:hypothetical protein